MTSKDNWDIKDLESWHNWFNAAATQPPLQSSTTDDIFKWPHDMGLNEMTTPGLRISKSNINRLKIKQRYKRRLRVIYKRWGSANTHLKRPKKSSRKLVQAIGSLKI